jgi:hypothetical protein
MVRGPRARDPRARVTISRSALRSWRAFPLRGHAGTVRHRSEQLLMVGASARAQITRHDLDAAKAQAAVDAATDAANLRSPTPRVTAKPNQVAPEPGAPVCHFATRTMLPPLTASRAGEEPPLPPASGATAGPGDRGAGVGSRADTSSRAVLRGCGARVRRCAPAAVHPDPPSPAHDVRRAAGRAATAAARRSAPPGSSRAGLGGRRGRAVMLAAPCCWPGCGSCSKGSENKITKDVLHSNHVGSESRLKTLANPCNHSCKRIGAAS